MNAGVRGWSIGAKLAAIAALFSAIMAGLALVAGLALQVVDGARAYVGGEGLWSKGQKDAVYHLARYARQQDPGDFAAYQQAIAIPLGDRIARLELNQPQFDPDVARRGFGQGLNAPEDIPTMIFLYRHFRFVERFDTAIGIWAEAEGGIVELLDCAAELDAAIRANALTPARRDALLDRIALINDRLTPLEQRFNLTIGETARWVRAVALFAIAVVALVLLAGGLAVAWWLARGVRRSIRGVEEALRATHALAASVIGTAHDAYIGMDAGGYVREWNRQAERTLGWTRDEAVGRRLADLIIPVQHRAAHQAGLERYLQTGEHRVLNQRIEITALHRGGREFPVELTIWALHDGDQVRFNAFLHDITERRRSVQRLAAQKTAAAALLGAATIEQAAPGVLQAVCEALEWDVGAIWLPAPGGAALRCTHLWRSAARPFPEFEEITRRMTFAPGVGLPGRVWTDGRPAWIPDVTQDPNFQRAQQARRDDLHAAFGFPIFSTANEVLGVIEFFSRHIVEPDEELLRMMGTLGSLLGQFIARRRAETELAARVDELARSNEELERFAYVASHDLQEPLRTLQSYTQLLLRRFADAADPRAAEFSGYVTAAVERMRALIDGLLAYSRVAHAQAALEPVDLNRLLAGALANLKDAIDGSGARIKAGPLPTLRVERSQITQVFQNLAGNALKFRGTAPPEIDIGATRHGAEWTIAVRDRGIGIDPQHVERIFGLFQRLHTRDVYPGNGLGLAICKRIVERHGGRIWVEAAHPGAVFRFTLPAAD